MSLRASVRLARGDLRLDATLEVAAGEVVVLLGPNGAGKSTLLDVLAGLVVADSAEVELDGVVLDAAGTMVEPRHRRVGLVPQQYVLFQHLSVLDNVAFGLRARGTSRDAAGTAARTWLARVGLADLAARRPAALSGGQAQRVALARALVTEPRLLLLDEPLAALDAGTRAAVRADLRRHLADYPGCALVVTHDPLEAMVLGDRVVVLEDGRVVQSGAPAEVARRPRTPYVARLVGLNLVRGSARGTEVVTDSGARVVLAHPVSDDGRAQTDALVVFAPAAVTLHRSPPEGSARNAWPGRVTGLEAHGDLVRVAVDGTLPLLADVTPAAVADLGLAPDVEVWSTVKATEVDAYPA